MAKKKFGMENHITSSWNTDSSMSMKQHNNVFLASNISKKIFFLLTSYWLFLTACGNSSEVKLTILPKNVTLENGLSKFIFGNPTGEIIQIGYEGVDQLLKPDYRANMRGYWDLVWEELEPKGYAKFSLIQGTKLQVIQNTTKRMEISFQRPWDPATMGNVIAMSYDIRYIMEAEKAGIYAMVVFRREANFPANRIFGGNRFTMRLNKSTFTEMWQSDWKHRTMPDDDDFDTGLRLAYKEAVHVTQGVFKGEVADKYQYSQDTEDCGVFGWTSPEQKLGLWYVFPSHEYWNGGPAKQQLTIQSGPVSLAVFSGSHLMRNNSCYYSEGETWEKIYGPFLIYLNKVSNDNTQTLSSFDELNKKMSSTEALWHDAKKQLEKERKHWPYHFVTYPNFVHKHKRANVTGRLVFWKEAELKSNKRFKGGNVTLENRRLVPAKEANIGLAAPGVAGSWQTESKYYQFWTKTDAHGKFYIPNIVPGKYNVNAWIPGVLGNFMHDKTLEVTAGQEISLGDLVFSPPRNGSTLWEIGIPDRTAAEFYIPDPPAGYSNPLFATQERWRQYGIWDRYGEIFTNGDLVYEVGKSDYKKDWWFAHLCRKNVDGNYTSTTWTVNFNLENVDPAGVYTLRIAIASSSYSRLQITFNKRNARPHFIPSLEGRDNAIARHGIHGYYDMLEFPVPPSFLRVGNNSLYLTQSVPGAFTGFMYDYLRLEGPA